MKLFRNRWMEATALVLIALWWGVPALRVWKADRLVDELYTRKGGDPVAPWHSAPHSCPRQAEEGLEKRIFRQARS